MSQNLPATAPKPQIMAGGQVAALIPQSLDEAFRVSQAIAASGLAPRGIDKPEQIMVAIMAGAELGLAPFQSLQSFAVVNGRPTLWGDGLLAVVRAQGVRVREWIEGEDDNMVAHCEAIRPDTGEDVARAFSVADAKRAGLWAKQGPWQQYPRRMLQMRARALALRDGCADMLRGMQVREEVEDFQPIRDVTPQTVGLRARLEQSRSQPQAGFVATHSEQTLSEEIDVTLDGDDIPADLGRGEGDQPPVPVTSGPSLDQRIADFKARLDAAPNTTKAKSIWAAAENLRRDLDDKDPERLPEIEDAFNQRFTELEDAEREG